MKNFFNAINIIFILGTIQGIILSIALIARKKGNKLANELLAIILSLLSSGIIIHCISHAMYLPFLTKNHTFLIILAYYNIGPLFYFYVKALTQPGFYFKKNYLIHFIPFIFSILLIFPIYLFTYSEIRNVLKIIVYIGLRIIIPLYMLFSIAALYKYSKEIKNNYSSLEKINLKWLIYLTTCLIAIIISFSIIHFIFNHPDEYAGNIMWIITSLLMYAIGYFGLFQPEIFSKNIINNLQEKNNKQKYIKSTLSAETADLYLKKLESAMQKEKIFLDNNLTLIKLAKELHMSIHHLSQVINEKIGKNYYDYINSNRVNEAKILLKNPDKKHLSIATISFDVGFNSISAFNAAFKKFVGITPSEYKKQKFG